MANAKQIEELKNILVERRDLITQNIQGSRDSIDSLKNSECNDEYDYAEVSSDSFKEGIIANQQIKELNEIEDALKELKKVLMVLVKCVMSLLLLEDLELNHLLSIVLLVERFTKKNNNKKDFMWDLKNI